MTRKRHEKGEVSFCLPRNKNVDSFIMDLLLSCELQHGKKGSNKESAACFLNVGLCQACQQHSTIFHWGSLGVDKGKLTTEFQAADGIMER